MNLILQNPLFLFGLAAAILPILIHRITQKKAAVRKFPAVRLLIQSQLVTARSRQLKELLLLALRILIIATIMFLMAKPILHRPGMAVAANEGAKVVILDNSLSMGYREDGGQRFGIAKSAIRQALEGFTGRIKLITTTGTGGEKGYPWLTPAEALQELDKTGLSSAGGNVTNAFVSAYEQLKDLKTSKQILVVSDLARTDWAALDLTKTGIMTDASVTFLRVGGSERDANFRIKDVSLAGGEMVAGIPGRLEVTIANFSSQSGTVLAEVMLSNVKVDQKALDLPAGGEARAGFDLWVEKPGWIDGEVRLTPDRLAADDVFYFPLQVKRKANVLIVDGDPKTSLKAGESYYLASALRPGGYEASPFPIRVIGENELARADLRFYDTLLLLNVARPDFSRLASFLEMGKPVVLFLGDRIDPAAYNRFPLSPWQIREKYEAGGNGERALHIDELQRTSHYLASLGNSLKSASFRTFFRIEGTGKQMLALGNGAPLLLRAEAGKSRLYLYTSSADLGWNDLPLKAAYLPLVQGLVKEAVGLASDSLPAGIVVGEAFPEDGPPIWRKGAKEGTGIVQFRLPEGERRRAVNTPPGESDLVKMTATDLKKKFGAVDVHVAEYDNEGLKTLPGGPKELWPYLLALLLALLGMEMIYANGITWFRRREG